MTVVHIDFESYSTVDLRKTGVHVYAESPTTDLWCIAYAIGDGPIEMWTPVQPCPDVIMSAVAQGWFFYAWNAQFERTMWNHILTPRYGWPKIPLEQWRCTMAQALALSFPGKLELAAPAVGLTSGKDAEGHALMLRMARPRSYRTDGGTPIWWDTADKVSRLAEYCKRDVEVERAIHNRITPLTANEQQMYYLDQRINDRGVYVDADLCDAAKKIVTASAEGLNATMFAATEGSVSACSNVGALVAFCQEQGVEVESLRKDKLTALLAKPDLPPAVRDALELRREAAKASVKKIDSAMRGRNADGRARGLFAFHAATTGRWAGRRFQPQNLQRPGKVDVEQITTDILAGNIEGLERADGGALAAISNAIRGVVRAAPGHRLIAGDFSNIESRVLAWLADEQWKLDSFRNNDLSGGHDIYVLGYARAFGIDPGVVDSQQRLVGKVMELALGFGGGVGAFQSMARNYGVTFDDTVADNIKASWRGANEKIVKFWWDLEDAAFKALAKPGERVTVGKVCFLVAGSFLWVRLPSGRPLAYPYPGVGEREVPWLDANGKKAKKRSFVYKTSVNRQWVEAYAYGGLWAENLTQAVARDILAEAMMRLDAAGYPIVLHAHDEAVAEVALDRTRSVEEFCALMSKAPEWAEGLPIAAEGWAGTRYRKG